MAQPKIMSITWNLSGLRICESLDPNEVVKNRSGYFTTWKEDCQLFDVWPTLGQKIKEGDPDLILIGLQEYPRTGNYMHDYLLPLLLSDLGFQNLGTTGLNGVSQLNSYNGLKLLVYAKKEVDGFNFIGFKTHKSKVNLSQLKDKYPVKTDLGDVYERNGAIAAYLKLSNNQQLTFLTLQLPWDQKNWEASLANKTNLARMAALDINGFIFNDIYNKLITKESDFMIVAGDLNFRVQPGPDMDPILAGTKLIFNWEQDFAAFWQTLQEKDELNQLMASKRIPKLNEGYSAKQDEFVGPYMYPTCTLVKNRKNQNDLRSYNLQKGVPSYCDRILYGTKTSNKGEPEIYSYEYGSIDEKVITNSEHSMVYSLLTFRIKN